MSMMPGAGYGTAQIWNEELAPHKGEQIVDRGRDHRRPRFLASFVEQARQ
jgi:hypothetical protein